MGQLPEQQGADLGRRGNPPTVQAARDHEGQEQTEEQQRGQPPTAARRETRTVRPVRFPLSGKTVAQAWQHQDQQRHAEQRGDGAGRNQMGRERRRIRQHQDNLVGRRQHGRADARRPDQSLVQGSRPKQTRQRRGGETEKADHADLCHHQRRQYDRHQQGDQACPLDLRPQAARGTFTTVEQHQRSPHQPYRQHAGRQPGGQMAAGLPARLLQRATAPDLQPQQQVVVNQGHRQADRSAVEIDHHAREDHRHRRQLLRPGQGQHHQHCQGATAQSHQFTTARQATGHIKRVERQGQIGAGKNPQGHGLGQRVAQHLLHQRAGQAQRRATEQCHGDTRQQRLMHQHLTHIITIRGQ